MGSGHGGACPGRLPHHRDPSSRRPLHRSKGRQGASGHARPAARRRWPWRTCRPADLETPSLGSCPTASTPGVRRRRPPSPMAQPCPARPPPIAPPQLVGTKGACVGRTSGLTTGGRSRGQEPKPVVPQDFSAMGAGGLEPPQSCDLRILSPSKIKSQRDVWGQPCLKRA